MGCESKTTQDSFICLVRKRGKKKAESRLPLSPNSPYVLILRPSGQTQACLAWDCLGPVLSYCAQMLKDQKGIKEKKSQTAWRNEEIASYYHGVFKRTVKKDLPCVLSTFLERENIWFCLFLLKWCTVGEEKKMVRRVRVSKNRKLWTNGCLRKCVLCLCRCAKHTAWSVRIKWWMHESLCVCSFLVEGKLYSFIKRHVVENWSIIGKRPK